MEVQALGEVTFDIIFKNGQPIDSKVGGSVVNTSVSLGRLGVPVGLVASIGTDEVSVLTRQFFKINNIDSSFLSCYEGTSRVALAFLDELNNATYSFYNGQNHNKKCLVFPDKASDLILFGSSFAIKPEIRTDLLNYLNLVSHSSIIYYDPNVRSNMFISNAKAKEWIMENIKLANIIKGSLEDFNSLFAVENPKEIYEIVKGINSNAIIFITSGKDGVDFFTQSIQKHYATPNIIPVSTIGAGDTFSAGIIYGLHLANASNENLNTLSQSTWDKAVEYAIRFSTEVCLSYDNYVEKRK